MSVPAAHDHRQRECPHHGHRALVALAVLLALLCLTRRAGGEAPLPVESPAYRAARKLLPERFQRYETSRFVVLSDAEAAWSRRQASRLERVHHQFDRFARQMNLQPRPLRHKLVCILFSRRDDYLTFARTNDEAQASWIAGYYAPAADRVVFYDLQDDAGILDARRKLEEMQEEVQSMERDAGTAQSIGLKRQAEELRANAVAYRRHVDRERQRLETFARSVSVATTVHEAVHQLLFHTGIQAAHVDYPVWISEGLATAFESDDTDLPFGPDREYEPRRQEFFRLLQNSDLLPLRRLVQIVDLDGADEPQIRRVYHQSYALVIWLHRYRRDELRAYLQKMRQMPPGDLSPRQQVAAFESAFGDTNQLERAWLRHEYTQFAEQPSAQLAGAHDDTPRQ